jgi:uncharacterized protein
LSAFLDTSFVLATLNADEPQHDASRRMLEAARAGRLGRLLTSDFVYDEAVTLALKRFGAARAREVDAFLGQDRLLTLLRVAPDEFDEARRRMLAHLDRGLSVTDWTIVVQCERRRVGTILSFDRGFDGIFARNAIPGP